MITIIKSFSSLASNLIFRISFNITTAICYLPKVLLVHIILMGVNKGIHFIELVFGFVGFLATLTYIFIFEAKERDGIFINKPVLRNGILLFPRHLPLSMNIHGFSIKESSFHIRVSMSTLSIVQYSMCLEKLSLKRANYMWMITDHG
jgi:hypothetical protein